jgi:hypothetical protein
VGEGGFSHSLSFLFVEVKVTVGEQKNLNTDVTSNQTQNPLNESSVSNHEITRSPGLSVCIQTFFFPLVNYYWLSEICQVARIIFISGF